MITVPSYNYRQTGHIKAHFDMIRAACISDDGPLRCESSRLSFTTQESAAHNKEPSDYEPSKWCHSKDGVVIHIVRMFRMIVEAVEFCHSQGLIHRDITAAFTWNTQPFCSLRVQAVPSEF